MEMKLTQPEIETALKKYVLSILTLAAGSELSISLAATRGPEGYTATVDIRPATLDDPKAETVDEPVPAQTQATSAPVTRKPKPVLAKQPEKTPDETEADLATTAQVQVAEKQPDVPEVATAQEQVADPVAKQQPGTGFQGFEKEQADEPLATDLGQEPDLPDEQAVELEQAEPAGQAAEPVKKPSLFANLRGK